MPVTSYHTLGGRIRGESVGGVRTDYLADALGSVTGTADQASSAVNAYRHKPHGHPLSRSGGGADPLFLWTGETGSRYAPAPGAEQFNRARHYATGPAVWGAVDPLWPGQPAYRYVNGNPTTFTDPSGMACATDCTKYQNEPGWYDNNPKLEKAIAGAVGSYSKYSQSIVGVLLYCIVARETRGDTSSGLPMHNGRPGGPCQLWPDKYKDQTCKGLKYRTNLADHLKCCARILCECLSYSGSDILKKGTNSNCATMLKGNGGSTRVGTWEVINEDQDGFEPHFKCCMIDRGWKNPQRMIPKA